MFKSASSAKRSWVMFCATRSRRRLAPNVFNWRISLLLDTPHHAVIVSTTERHVMP